MHRAWICVCAVVLSHSLFVSEAHAQTATSSFGSISAPGARASGMGLAFVAIADDGTATVVNPAGLMFLSRPQVQLEVKTSAEETSYRYGQITGLPARVPFLSFTMPLNERVAIGVSRYEPLAFDERFSCCGYEADLTTRSNAFAVSVATRMSRRVNLGFTVGGEQTDVDQVSSRPPGFVVSHERNKNDLVVVAGAHIAATENVAVGLSVVGRSANAAIDYMPAAILRGGVAARVAPRVTIAADASVLSYRNQGSVTNKNLHAGAEFAIPAGTNRGFLRAGVLTDQRLGGALTGNAPTETIGTVGGGFVAGQHLAIDVAFLTRKELVASTSVRF